MNINQWLKLQRTLNCHKHVDVHCCIWRWHHPIGILAAVMRTPHLSDSMSQLILAGQALLLGSSCPSCWLRLRRRAGFSCTTSRCGGLALNENKE